MSILQAENLTFTYPEDVRDMDLLAASLLNDVNFNIESGSMLHIKGKNGSGKTTLLKLIAGLLLPTSGTIKYNSQSIYQDVFTYQQDICYVGHKLGFDLTLTVFENCYFDLKNSYKAADIDALLKKFDLFYLRDKSCALLSSGFRRRVALLRLLLSNSKIWILDEPFNTLDKEFVALFIRCIRQHIMNSGVVIYTSHYAIDMQGKMCFEYNL